MFHRVHARASGVIGIVLLSSLILIAPAEASWQTPVPLYDSLLAFLANPNVAYLLLVLGLMALAAELATGGAVIPGITGVICLILALIGLGQLPTNWAGAVLILAGIVMLLLDMHVSGFALSVGGLVAFALGSLLLFTPPWALSTTSSGARISIWLILVTSGGVASFFLLALAAVWKSRSAPVAVGRRTLIGKVGTVRKSLSPEGIVHLEGEMWSAASALTESIPVGATVRVVGIEGLLLRVEPVVGDAPQTVG